MRSRLLRRAILFLSGDHAELPSDTVLLAVRRIRWSSLPSGLGSPDTLSISSLASITQTSMVPSEEPDPGTDPCRRHDQGVPASGCHAGRHPNRLMGTRGR